MRRQSPLVALSYDMIRYDGHLSGVDSGPSKDLRRNSPLSGWLGGWDSNLGYLYAHAQVRVEEDWAVLFLL